MRCMHDIRSRLDASASEQIGCKYCASRRAWAALAVRARGSDVGAGGTKCSSPCRVRRYVPRWHTAVPGENTSNLR